MQLTRRELKTTPDFIDRLARAGITSVEDLVWHLPRTYELRWAIAETIRSVDIRDKQRLRLTIELITTERTRSGKSLTKALLVDSEGIRIEAVWFHLPFQLRGMGSWARIIVFGQIQSQYGKLTMKSPEVALQGTSAEEVIPVYREIGGISSRWLSEKIPALISLISVEETVPKSVRKKNALLTKVEALRKIHSPKSVEDFESARKTLAYEELWWLQLMAEEKRRFLRTTSKWRVASIPLQSELMKSLIGELPFHLTEKQKIVLFQILKDMERDESMSRLLEWDVGTGKTAVAILSALHAVKVAGIQVAIMAPTEILAQQHFHGQQELLARLGVTCALLTGSVSAHDKKVIKWGLKDGSISIAFGTHALIQDDVHWYSLGYVIVDEQHRFGVEHRKALGEYASHATGLIPHRLDMTATPIPRSLALTMYGEQDLSILDQYPAWRLPIRTHVVRESDRSETYRAIELEIRAGHQVYWISPLVEDSDEIDAASAVSMHANLVDIFPHARVGLVHGRMPSREKEAVMESFYRGEIDILSATSVIEVGVDNPNATVMCIEAAERFGLSQLHQFRGRVGRWKDASICFLYTTKSYIWDRLKAIESTQNGFELAEIDLELRGPGEVYGVRQSGDLELRVADVRDIELVESIREDVREWMGEK